MLSMIWLFSLAVLFISLLRYYWNVRQLPSGPFPLPIIGNFYNALNPPRLNADLVNISRKFGRVFTFFMPFPVVNVGDFDVLKKIAKTDSMSDRVENIIARATMTTENGGIVLASGDNWREQRRTALSILREFGMGKSILEEKVLRSARDFVSNLQAMPIESGVELRLPIQLFVANVISDVLFGCQHDVASSTRLMAYADGVSEYFAHVAGSKAAMAVMTFPWLRFLPYFSEHGYGRFKRNFDKLLGYIREEVAASAASYRKEEGAESDASFVHAYLRRMDSGNDALTKDQLINSASDLFIGGMETTTTTLRWGVLFLARHPHIQERIRDEITNVAEDRRQVTMADKARMPYTSATIHEMQRKANVILLATPVRRRATEDIHVDGFHIPAGTIINDDLHMIHSSDPIFEDPAEFRPERYLEEDGRTLRKDLIERTIPFGIGKRICPGEGMARLELFVGLTTLLQNFRILRPLDGNIDTNPHPYFGHLPKEHAGEDFFESMFRTLLMIFTTILQ